MRRIEFIGNETTSDHVIRPRVLLDEGKPFRESLLRKSIRRINALGIFEHLSERDVDIRTGDQDTLYPDPDVVDLRIHFKEKRKTTHKHR